MSNFNISLSPAQFEFVLQPGAVITQAYEIENLSDNSINLYASVQPWQPIGSDGAVSYANITPNPNINFSLSNADIQLNKTFTLAPKQKQQLVLKIKTSDQLSLEDYYYTFFVTQNQTGVLGSEENQSQILGQIGSHLLLSASKTAETPFKARFQEFSVTPKFKDIFLTPLKFSAKIENKSEYFFKTEGKITVTKNNLKFKELQINPQNVLARHTRNITCQNPNDENNFDCTLKPPLWPGHYAATISLNSTDSAQATSISFYVFPFSIIAFLGFSFALFLIFWQLRNMLTRKRIVTEVNRITSVS